jgi:6,7-dimethyl-8-ribityllumazine synthase
MIRSFHKLLVAANDKEFSALVDFFDSLGLARGEAWDGRRSKGIKLDAREAGVEIGTGQGFPNADLVIECDSADVLYEIAKKRKVKVAEEIEDTDWGARIFSVELPARKGRLAIFSYKDDWRSGPAKKLGELNAAGKKFGIVVSRFNAFITERLLSGALDALKRTGASDGDITVVRVPGSFELPLAARKLAQSGADAVICLACIIRGETTHYEHLAQEVTRGIGQSAQETGVPHAYGVLTCENLEQAIDRAGLKMGNKGFDAALSAVEMASLSSVVGPRSSAKQKRARPRPTPGRGLIAPTRKRK